MLDAAERRMGLRGSCDAQRTSCAAGHRRRTVRTSGGLGVMRSETAAIEMPHIESG